MLQRVQTVYLGLVFLLMAIMSFLPLVSFSTESQTFYMTAFNFRDITNITFVKALPNLWPITILSSLVEILCLISIFRYKKRSSQLLINMIAMFANFGLLVSIFFLADFVAKFNEVNDKFTYNVGAFFPIITVLLFILANRNIRKDEKLIKESNRLR